MVYVKTLLLKQGWKIWEQTLGKRPLKLSFQSVCVTIKHDCEEKNREWDSVWIFKLTLFLSPKGSL